MIAKNMARTAKDNSKGDICYLENISGNPLFFPVIEVSMF